MLTVIAPQKVRVSKEGVAAFNRRWPCSPLDPKRAYWFEFDHNDDLIDTDVPEHSDGEAALALAEDCLVFLRLGDTPVWAE